MRTITELVKPSEFEALIKSKKRETFSILYYSPWDMSCKKLLKRLDDWKSRDGDTKLYLVSSWELPRAFSSFSITSAPSLVHIKKGRVKVSVEYPRIYSYFSS